VKLFEKAAKHHPLRVHADQFTSLGMIPEAIRLHARSVDHLEASTKADLVALAGSPTFGVILPCTGFHTDGRFARAGFFVDQGGAVALATNCNPGSAPGHSMPFAIALAVRRCGLTPQEAIAACTVNAAALARAHGPGHRRGRQAGGPDPPATPTSGCSPTKPAAIRSISSSATESESDVP
jgi:imidazolonepropionase